MLTVSVSYYYCNKLPPSWWLRTSQLLSYCCGCQKSKMDLTGLKSKYQQGCVWALLEALRQNPLLCLFQLLWATHMAWLMDPFHLQKQQSHHSTPCSINTSPDSVTPTSLFHSQGPLGLFQAHLDHPEQSPHLQVLKLTTSAKSLLLCKILRFQRLGLGPLWGTMIMLSTLTILPTMIYMAKQYNEIENIIFSVIDENFEVSTSEFKVTEPARGRNSIQSS